MSLGWFDLGFAVSAVVLLAGLSRRKKRPLPPGPKGLPVLGNLLDMPRESEWLTFQQWARDYGMHIVSWSMAY